MEGLARERVPAAVTGLSELLSAALHATDSPSSMCSLARRTEMTLTQHNVLAHIVAVGRPAIWFDDGETSTWNTPSGTRHATLERLHTLGYVTRKVATSTIMVGVGLFGRDGERRKKITAIQYHITKSGRQALTT